MNARARLGEIADIHTGTAIDRKSRTATGIRVFGLDQVTGRVSELPACMPEDSLPSKATRLRADDVVIALIGQPGRSGVVGQEYDGAVLDRECAVLRLRDPHGPITTAWLALWSRSTDCRTQMQRHTTGTTIPRVPIRAVRDLEVPVIDIHSQQGAWEELRRLDEAVEVTRRTLAVLEELRTVEIDLRVYGAHHSRGQR